MVKTIYLVRHGQTLFNFRHKTQGRIDSPLTELGKRQALAAGKFFEKNNIKFDRAFTSTQERANDTLELITHNSLPYKRLKNLREKDYGIYEGQDEFLLPWNRGLERDFEPTMEKDSAVVERMERGMQEVFSQTRDGETVLVVGHGDILGQYVRKYKEELEFSGFKNCAYVKMSEENGKIRIEEAGWPAENIH
ncbi:histidine phosphatase family protein [Lactobacillus sp. PV037]|uniref:histidine phosphatase family protein n=1 Tax=Lactobacillus sp. PV037 TaxID=2594496 RepID=UPI00223ECFF1|nr:histidine phosphatase family protein [Lactobacillus sp. PV037]QNQ83180.1 histidine phosphatase family protein [Lactobacillus sp. PV037]